MLVQWTGLYDHVMRTTQLSNYLVLEMQNRWLLIKLENDSLSSRSSDHVCTRLYNPDVLAAFVLDKVRLSPSVLVFSQDQHKLRCLVVLTKECRVNWHNIDFVIFNRL